MKYLPVRCRNISRVIVNELREDEWATANCIGARIISQLPPEAIERRKINHGRCTSGVTALACQTLFNLTRYGTLVRRKNAQGVWEYSKPRKKSRMPCWSAEETDFLVDNWADMRYKDIASKLGRTMPAVRHRVWLLKKAGAI